MSKSNAELDAQILQAMRYLADLLEQRAPSGGLHASGQMTDSSAALVSIKEACRITSLSRTSINEKRAAGAFPQPVPLGDKRIAFVKSEVEQWVKDRIAMGRSKP